MTINVWNALFFLVKYTWSFDDCRSQLFCGIGFIWVLAILDSALQINIRIKARSLYLHLIPALRLHLWSLVLIIALLWLIQCDWYPFRDTLNERLFYGLYHRFSANCRAIFVLASLKFGLKVELKKGFSEIILPTVSDVWVVRWRSPKKSPKIRQYYIISTWKQGIVLQNVLPNMQTAPYLTRGIHIWCVLVSNCSMFGC